MNANLEINAHLNGNVCFFTTVPNLFLNAVSVSVCVFVSLLGINELFLTALNHNLWLVLMLAAG